MHGSSSDLPKTVDVDELTIHETDWGDYRVSIIKCHKNLDITPLLKGLPDDRCQCPHWGFIVSGRKLVKYRDHEETLMGGDAYFMPPGHTTITDAGTEWVEFSPRKDLEETNKAVSRNVTAMAQG
jgi:hypothetical protein